MSLENHFLFSHQPSFDWDLHTFEVEDVHGHMPLGLAAVMESPLSSESSEASTGYLQDAVAEWSDRCKRRRTAAFCTTADFELPAEDIEDLLQGFWDSTCHEDDPLNFLVQNGRTSSSSSKVLDPHKPPTLEASTKTQEGKHHGESHDHLLSPPPSQNREVKDSKPSHHVETHDHLLSALKENTEVSTVKRKKKKAMGLVYPFAVVKPGGSEGEVTLEDINERLLMRPSRPVRHPVGEYACMPCVSADGPGLSGKAVVGLTRIHTQGRGTITIIRTRG
ncbi:hypothetical protein J5N97_005661 [Dioscorea zingiberensis]|uniref:Protein XRI1 n=1 Tax=Dioscorea zingiberensis TaxID=325984 RepID=A0A9D5D8J5_9LILI|nr:hypothetical protein J5N97_005661 [Dioscorea zingiberensis]